MMLGYSAYSVYDSGQRLTEQRDTAVAENAVVAVSDPLAQLCATDPTIRARVGAACDTAAAVAASPADDPVAVLEGRPGEAGRPGADGLPGVP
ncbi:MAG: hypothetical protein ACRCZP_05230, partial [Phycicoccus sp.]